MKLASDHGNGGKMNRNVEGYPCGIPRDVCVSGGGAMTKTWSEGQIIAFQGAYYLQQSNIHL